jgi:protein SCO1/2
MIVYRPLLFPVLLAALVMTLAGAGTVGAQEASSTPGDRAVIPSPIGNPVPAPDLAGLVYPDLSPFDLADLEGSPVLLYFGYTHCPDVCPATLGELFGVWEVIPDMQAVYVTVDPERDTPEFLEEWTRYLPENLHALTGSPGAIRLAADSYGVRYARVETTSTSGYTMSHTAELYLIDEHGQLLLSYPFGTPAAEIAADIATLQAE